jgi:hypothetical protein
MGKAKPGAFTATGATVAKERELNPQPSTPADQSGLSVAPDIADIGENNYRADELFSASLYQLSRIFFISLRASASL